MLSSVQCTGRYGYLASDDFITLSTPSVVVIFVSLLCFLLVFATRAFCLPLRCLPPRQKTGAAHDESVRIVPPCRDTV